MRDIANMSFEELVRLNNEVLTVDEMDQLHEHELVANWENMGQSGNRDGLTWWDITITHPQDGWHGEKRIDVYTER